MVAASKMKAQVSERALLARINRRLEKDERKICRARGFWDGPNWHEDSSLGRYYVLDWNRNFIVNHHVDLESFGRELGALNGWEELADEED